jgi:hypothetical protein
MGGILGLWSPFLIEHRGTMSFMDLEDEEDANKLNSSFKHVNL